MNGTGTGTRTLNLGNGTWTLTTTTAAITPWNMNTTTNLTFNANSSTIKFSAVTSGQRTFLGGGLTYNNLQLDANASGGTIIIAGSNTFNGITLAGGSQVNLSGGTTQTVTSLTAAGTPAAPVYIASATPNTASTISAASGSISPSFAAIRDMIFSGGATFTANNSLDLGHNSGITIIPPSWLVNPHMTGGMA